MIPISAPPSMAAPDDASLAARVHATVRDAILSLELLPGAVVRKAEICARLGVSRSPVAEAMARLASEGLVEIVPQSGTRVTRFSMAGIRESAFLREALEVAAVRAVARRGDPAQVVALRATLEDQARLVEAGDMAGFFAADQAFHGQIAAFTGLRRLGPAIGRVSLQLDRARALLLPAEGRSRDTVGEHRAIVDAIAAKDPGAADAAMHAHLSQLIERLTPLRHSRPDLFDDDAE